MPIILSSLLCVAPALHIYVDGVVIAGNDLAQICHLKQYLHDRFHIKDLGHFKYFFGIEVARNTDGIVLSQREYALDLL